MTACGLPVSKSEKGPCERAARPAQSAGHNTEEANMDTVATEVCRQFSELLEEKI